MLVKFYHSQLHAYLNRAYAITAKAAKGDKPPAVYIHGRFGIGKTAAVRTFAKAKAAELGLEYSESFKDVNNEKKFVLLVIVLHQYEPAELKGLPFPDDTRTKTIYLPMGLLPVKGQGVIFFDEINLAPPMIANNAYQIVEDRKLGMYEVPEGYLALAAGNLMDDQANTFNDPMPLNNRFLHLELNTPAVMDINIGTEEAPIMIPGWATWAIKRGIDHRIINYLMYQQKYIFTYNPASDVYEVTVATPRIWEKLSPMIEGVADDDPILPMIIGTGVGEALGLDFCAWLGLSTKYDIPEVYKTGKLSPIPREVDKLYSLTSALISYYLAGQTDAKAVRLFELAHLFPSEHKIMILSMAKHMDTGKDKFFDRIKRVAPDKYRSFADDAFKLLI